MKPTNKYRRIQVKNADPPIALTLKDEIRVLEGGQCSLYSVNETPTLIVKLMNLIDEQIYQKFQQEVLAWSRMREEKPIFPMKQTKDGKYDSFQNIVNVTAAFRQMMKDSEMGVLVMEYCPKGSLESICQRLPALAFREIQIVKVAKDLLQGLCYLHCRSSPLIHRQVTMQHLLLGEDHNYKLVNFSHVTTHRYSTIQSDELEFIATEIKKHTCVGYRAPELIDLAQGSVIDERVDVFAGGVVLFQLCYGQPPFQGAIATLNNKVEIPEFPVYSSSLSGLLKLMLTRDAKERPTSSALLEYVLKNWNEFKISDNEKSPEQQKLKRQLGGLDMEMFQQEMNKAPMKSTMLNKFKKLVTLKLQNKRTKGWILAALEENELPPKQKYVKSLILKAWQQPNKIEKFYDYFNLFIQANCSSSVLTLKALLLLDEYIKKGPPAAVGVLKKLDSRFIGQNGNQQLQQQQQQQQSAVVPSAQTILEKIIISWEKIDSKDKQRSGYATQLIQVLSATLLKKIELCSEYACVLEANFSLKPFFESIEKSYSKLNSNYKSLSGKLMEDLLGYFTQLISLSQQILANNFLLNIQMALMFQFTDELFCFISTFTHLHAAFLMSSNYLDSHIDKVQLRLKLDYISSSFEVNINAARHYFKKAQNAVEHLGVSKKNCLIPQIDTKIIDYIRAIPRLQVQDVNSTNQFFVQDYLNSNTSICGLRLPISYGTSIGTNQQAVSSNSNSSNTNDLHLIIDPDCNEDEGQQHIDQKQDQKIKNNNNIKNPSNFQQLPHSTKAVLQNAPQQQLDGLFHGKKVHSVERVERSLNKQKFNYNQINNTKAVGSQEYKKENNLRNDKNASQEDENDDDDDNDEDDDNDCDSQLVNENNNNYNDILDENDEYQNFSLDPEHKQMGNIIVSDKKDNNVNQNNSNTKVNTAENIPKNLEKCKDFEFIDFNVKFNNNQTGKNSKNTNNQIDQITYQNNNTFQHAGQKQLSDNKTSSKTKPNNFTGINFQFAEKQDQVTGDQIFSNKKKPLSNLFPQNNQKLRLDDKSKKLSDKTIARDNINRQQNKDQDDNGDQDDFNFVNKNNGGYADHAEEFEEMQIDENNPTIQHARDQGGIQKYDQNMNTQTQQNDQEIPHASVTSSNYSSNSEHFIELKNFIINRVKHDPNELIIDFKSLTIGKKIGSGHSGKVFQGVLNNVEVAIKEMEVNQLNERNQKEFQREIETLVKISPQINLVSLIGVAQKKDNFYVITELCTGGTMFELLHKKQATIPLPWMHRLHMAKHIATGMIYLHSLQPPVIHRDLKSLNLLLDIAYREDSFEYNVKIADFGLARTESKGEMTQVLGTFHWMAPEVFQNKQYTTKADVYSYGIVLWEVINRKTPYSKLSTVEIMKSVCEGKRPETDMIPEECPQKLVDLMKDCWQQDQALRPPFTEILQRLEAIEEDLKDRKENPRPPPVNSNRVMNQETDLDKMSKTNRHINLMNNNNYSYKVDNFNRSNLNDTNQQQQIFNKNNYNITSNNNNQLQKHGIFNVSQHPESIVLQQRNLQQQQKPSLIGQQQQQYQQQQAIFP